MQCKAKSKRSGVRCERAAMRGKAVCYMHGGKSPAAGPTHPNFKHGLFSKALNGKSIQDKYELLRADPHLLQLNEEIALMMAWQVDTVERLGSAATASGLEQMRLQWNEMLDALNSEDNERFWELFEAMGALLRQGLDDHELKVEFMMRAEAIRRLKETERKYREGLGLYLPLERADAIMQVWLDCIRRVVPREYIAALYEEFRKTRLQHGPPTIGDSGSRKGRDVTSIAKRGA